MEKAPAEKKHHIPWITWLVAVALLAAVILVASKFSEREQFEETIRNARPAWIWFGVLLQIGTYALQAVVYRLFLRKSHEGLPLGRLLRLSLAEISISQVLPSAGASGSIFLADGFKRHGIQDTTIGATILGSVLAYYIAYILSVLACLIVLDVERDLHLLTQGGAPRFSSAGSLYRTLQNRSDDAPHFWRPAREEMAHIPPHGRRHRAAAWHLFSR